MLFTTLLQLRQPVFTIVTYNGIDLERRKDKVMKKIFAVILAITLLTGVFAFAACQPNDTIVVVGREASSGTREAFDKVVAKDGVTLESFSEEANPNGDAEGGYKEGALYFTGTSGVASKVATSKNAIGYISLGSVDDTIKALSVNGVAPSAETVISGEYSIQRPFVIMTNKTTTLTAVTADFLNFLKSSTAQEIVTEEKAVSLTDETQRNAPVTEYSPLTTAPEGDLTIKVRGSTSMADLMDALVGKYIELNPWMKQSNFQIDLQGSSTGRSAVDADTVGNVIGMASSAEKSDTPRNYFNIALDAVAVIVNKDSTLTNITLEQLFDIYTGAITKYSELVG